MEQAAVNEEDLVRNPVNDGPDRIDQAEEDDQACTNHPSDDSSYEGDDEDTSYSTETDDSQHDERQTQMEEYFANYRGSIYRQHDVNSVYRTMNHMVSRVVNWPSSFFFRKKTPPTNDTLSRLMGRNRGRSLFIGTRPERGFSSGWKGTRILGTGGQGIVGLWEWQGRGPSPLPPHAHIVVKKVIGSLTLNRECRTMLRMGNRGNHTVRLLYPSSRAQCRRARYDPVRREMRGQKRLVLEYCDEGDLQTFLRKQKERNQRIPENSLWHIFLCLAKALSIMDHGTETPEREAGSDFTSICHFDLKPLNVFIGGSDKNPEEHSVRPIIKIGDFGLAMRLPVPEKLRRRVRQQGTPGYYAPEQFSRRWRYSYPDQSETVGNYGTHTNIWQVGAIMYQLVTLGPTPFPNEIRCAWLHGLTYGNAINEGESLDYSQWLQMLIWRCLSEKPRYRPSLRELHDNITRAIALGSDVHDLRPQDEPEEHAVEGSVEPSSSARSTEDDSPGRGDAGHALRFQVLRRDTALGRLPIPVRAAWFQADGRDTIGDLKRTIRRSWLPAAWPEIGMGERRLWLLGEHREIPDDDDNMTLREWGVMEDSRIYIRVPEADYFVREEELRFEEGQASNSGPSSNSRVDSR